MNSVTKAIRNFFTRTDIILWILTLAALMYSVLLIKSMQRTSDYNYLQSQTIAIVAGLIAAIIISVTDYNRIVHAWWLLAGIGLIMFILVFLFGINVAGTDDTAWLRLPGGFSFQPSELVKVIFIITFSKHLSVLIENDKLHTLWGVLSLGGHVALPVLLVHLQGDDGTALVFAIMFIIMAFASGVQIRYFLIMLLVLCTSVPILWKYVLNDEHKNRFLAVFDIDGNAMTNYGWQQFQGKVSIASGGLNGYGLNNGPRVAAGIVPEQENDFILTVAGEELGFIGCSLLLLILLLITVKTLINASKSRDIVGKFICIGVFSMIASQTVINVAMVLGLMPVIGITLPFFSSGGSSVLALLISIGLVQSVYYNKDKIERKGLSIKNKYKYSYNTYM